VLESTTGVHRSVHDLKRPWTLNSENECALLILAREMAHMVIFPYGFPIQKILLQALMAAAVYFRV
jgi:hypothetical protein